MDWKDVIKTVAPWIGTALGGPMGGMAVTAVANALGLSDATEASIKSVLSGATQEQLLAIKEADQNFALQMQALGFANIKDLESIAAADRDSARHMQIAAPSFIPAALTCALLIAFVGTLILVSIYKIPQENKDLVVYMIGQLGGGFTVSLAFWFGTTRQSENKTAALAAK